MLSSCWTQDFDGGGIDVMPLWCFFYSSALDKLHHTMTSCIYTSKFIRLIEIILLNNTDIKYHKWVLSTERTTMVPTSRAVLQKLLSLQHSIFVLAQYNEWIQSLWIIYHRIQTCTAPCECVRECTSCYIWSVCLWASVRNSKVASQLKPACFLPFWPLSLTSCAHSITPHSLFSPSVTFSPFTRSSLLL